MDGEVRPACHSLWLCFSASQAVWHLPPWEAISTLSLIASCWDNLSPKAAFCHSMPHLFLVQSVSWGHSFNWKFDFIEDTVPLNLPGRGSGRAICFHAPLHLSMVPIYFFVAHYCGSVQRGEWGRQGCIFSWILLGFRTLALLFLSV
jgi:hypothetical protein